MENNLSTLETDLADIEKRLKETVTLGLEMISGDPSLEKKILTMFTEPAMSIYSYFMKETERTGTESVGKSVIKYAMFKKF